MLHNILLVFFVSIITYGIIAILIYKGILPKNKITTSIFYILLLIVETSVITVAIMLWK